MDIRLLNAYALILFQRPLEDGQSGPRGRPARPSACTGGSATAPTRGRPTAARTARAGTPPQRGAAAECAEVRELFPG